MNWEKFIQEMKLLSEKIDYKPNFIVAISRGGLIPARMLSSFLYVKKLHCLSISKVEEERKVITEILESLEEKNVLVVEDMLETGKSLIAVKQYLESKGAQVKTTCLYTMPISEIKPDFYLKQIPEVEKFPWEVDEQ